jgi:homoserine kinase type II
MPDVARVRALYARYVAERDPSLPFGVVHGDLFRDNVLWKGGELLALLDFESACWHNFAYDLMVTAFAWCYGAAFDLELVRALFEGYRSVRQPTAAEIAALPCEGAIACLRFATTRLTDFSLRVAPGEKPVRSYQRFLDRLAALESAALSPVFAALG